MKYGLVIILVVFCFLKPKITGAETINWATESWENFTNKDGSGLYYDIVKAVFSEHQLVVTEMPWKRSLLEIKNGTADMTGATSFVDGLVASHYAILAPPISILYIKNKFSYTDQNSITDSVAVWASPYEDELMAGTNTSFFNGFSVSERETAYKLLLSGRADYFIDAKALHLAWLHNAIALGDSQFSASDFQLKDIGHTRLFMIFSNNARGRRFKDIFDQGIAALAKRGELGKIYQKYNLVEQMPQHPE